MGIECAYSFLVSLYPSKKLKIFRNTTFDLYCKKFLHNCQIHVLILLVLVKQAIFFFLCA